MQDFGEGISKAVTSPAGQFAFGLGLFYGIQKFFEEVEKKLNLETRIQIWMWLADLVVSDRVRTWPHTFALVFDRVFGRRHLSWRCFYRSCIASYVAALVFGTALYSLLLYIGTKTADPPDHQAVLLFLLLSPLYFNLIPDYISLLETRVALHLMGRTTSLVVTCIIMLGDAVASAVITLAPIAVVGMAANVVNRGTIFGPSFGFHSWSGVIENTLFYPSIFLPFILAGFVTSVWLWLYAGAGFLLRAARQLDAGFGRIKRWFDIENKPLQAIGLVSGAVCAIVYWAFALARAVL